MRLRRRTGTDPVVSRATYEALHRAWSAAPPLRQGLQPVNARKSARHLRSLLGTQSLLITDVSELVAWDGSGFDCHGAAVVSHAMSVLETGRSRIFGRKRLGCTTPDCPARYAVIAPLTVDERVVGTLGGCGAVGSPGLVRATVEVSRWVSGQLELAELDRSRSRLLEAELTALRAQISPHFIYNSLTVIASFVRTDPDRARELLLEFADFTRYSFRRHGEFTTLAEELRSIDQYLTLQRARYGSRLRVTLRIAPEVLPVAVPFLCLQPLVENAIQHGMEGRAGPGQLSIVASDEGVDAHITVEDDGVGMDPEVVRRALAGQEMSGIALGNIDERLRHVFGDEYGLVVETALGAGTKVHVRVPKYHAGVQAS
ncbi:histidine kinase [Actinocrispum sp. NPDC049592]|uniref:sensor histidine kinase n=1 Tax=Actinocrispum sp. NPDC049592 TaxID=3154835 RepID=UPI003421FC61